MLTLYFTPNTCSLASHIALEDAGAAYELKHISFKATEQQSPAYVKLNPKARVPALVTPRGVLTETPAMLAFIAQSFPDSKLAPLDDPFVFAEIQSFNSYLCSTGTPRARAPDARLSLDRRSGRHHRLAEEGAGNGHSLL